MNSKRNKENPKIDRVLFSAEQISQAVQRLGAEISRDYADRELTVVSVLKGSVIFSADLVRALTVPCTVDFMSVSSYQDGTSTSGLVQLELDLRQNPQGKNLLLVEDILDSGLTLQYLLKNLQARRPASLKVCTLLDKPTRRHASVRSDYTGFNIGDDFVVGYGLDYAEQFRNLPYIAVVSKG